MKHRRWLTLAVLLVVGMIVHADEGMWMPHQMKDLDLEKQGLRMDPGALYKEDGTGLMSAVVSFGGGTGEFVSDRGLLLTNHHVAFGALQRASTKEHDYIADGFYAPADADEIRAINYHADVLLGYEDVTDRFRAILDADMAPLARYHAIEDKVKALVAEEEAKASDRRCVVRSFYAGNRYYLFRFKRIRDIRIVYAPPRSIGNFGGDVDNWMWPRHTGDFTFLRAYVAPDGTGSEYSPDNVPYRPKVWLKPSLDGLKEGDFTFVMGYPGRTYRNMTAAEFEQDAHRLKERLALYRKVLSFFEEAGKADREIEIRYASLTKGLNNGLKNMTGKLEGFEKVHLLERKRQTEATFRRWCGQDVARKEYLDHLEQVAAILKESRDLEQQNLLAGMLVNGYAGPALLSQAHLIVRTVTERAKPDMEREAGFQERDLPGIKARVKFRERGYDLAVDRRYMKELLKWMATKPAAYQPASVRPLLKQGDAAIDAFVDDLYDHTKLADAGVRLALLDEKPETLAKNGDGMLKLAAELERELKDLREKTRALAQRHQDLKRVVMKGMLEMTNGRLAPDANSTIRFTSGTVQGYSPRDAVWYQPFTTLTGVMEKETGTFPFAVPAKLKALYEAKDFGRYADPRLHNIVTCFLNTTNVTGGNSGSPVLNADGRQVGIVFDMTYESVIGDYLILPEYQRTIHVDIRYVLFVTEKFGGATRILKEMSL